MNKLLLLVMSALMLTACGNNGGKAPNYNMAKVACDESFENIMQQEIEVYEYIYPKESVMPVYVSENAAIDSLMKITDFRTAVITRPLTGKEIAYIKDHNRPVYQQKIAVDALALIVNKDNPVSVLSKKDIAEILTGEVQQWDQVEPCDLGKIEVVFDHQGSSTVNYMRDSILGGKEFGPNVYAQKTSTAVFEAVKNSKNAIGIIGVSWITSDLKGTVQSTEQLARAAEASDTTQLDFDQSIKVLKIRGNEEVTAYKPYQAYIFDGSYPLFRQIWMVTTQGSGSTNHRFFSFVTGFQGQKLIQMTGVLPATVRPRMVELR